MSIRWRDTRFDMHHFHTWRTFTLTVIMQLSLLLSIWTAFLIESNWKVSVMSLTILISIIALVWQVIETRKTKPFKMAKDQLQYGALIITLDNIDEIAIAGNLITIKLVHKIRSYSLLRLRLKHKNEAKALYGALQLFCSEHLVELKVESHTVSKEAV
ncbi:hypothetical protein D3P09_22000 [Paenibacillus pinisoli]|uniref:Uncharacterized protein n=1 Tax=Paenibacillus pinisoli TaxID=1276110 RepID=A0A3A6PHJ6_9BACL|nr:hypothetical protein [Paenibacillus pinisoli]RJX37649.1 hypothetical protein D3P09_22000 [Paenibacillus pinisoli]